MTADPSAGTRRVEYVVRDNAAFTWPHTFTVEQDARDKVAEWNFDYPGDAPHIVIERTITERDITDEAPDATR